MSTTQYFRLALLQYIKMHHNLEDVNKTVSQIEQLKLKIASKHKKHRRSDKEIEKIFNCSHCQRIYATEVALRLHLKLKHQETILDKHSDSQTVVVNDSYKEIPDLNIEAA